MKNIIKVFAIFFSFSLLGQKIKIHGTLNTYIDGKVTTPLFGGEVFLKNAGVGDISNDKGLFSIETDIHLPDTILVRASGYYSDTLIIKEAKDHELNIVLFPEFVAEEVVIKARRANSNILRLDPRNVEQLTQGELRKAACCSLSESFETNATVDVSLSDGVSGSKRIQMMGLEGRYIQLQFENIPFMHNLDQPFGLSSIPGPWIESIQITKGAGTVVNGYESMAGLINVEYLKPTSVDKLFVNGYTSIQGRGELNVQGGTSLNDKWGTAWFVHGSTVRMENDRGNDGFRDIPIGETFIGLSRWSYSGDKMEANFGMKANFSDQQGGQVGYNRYANQHNQGLYGVGIRNLNVELFSKTGFFFEKNPFSSIGIIAYGKHNDLSTVFGNRSLEANEKRGYLNALYENIIGSTNHSIKSGVSLVYDELNQVMDDRLPTDTSRRELNRKELVPGVFTEYTYTGAKSVVVLGARGDYHNLYGWQFTPRANYKFNLTEDLALRATAGRGFRVSNYMTDNLSMMSTNTPWVVDENIEPEVSWNFGGSLLWDFNLFGKKATWTADFYHTLFTSQLIVDRDESSDYIRMRNLEGESFSNAFQTDFKINPFNRFEMKMAYKYLDVKSTTGGILETVLMVPKHRGFINLAYETRNRRWAYDVTLSVFGPQRLAKVQFVDGTYSQDNMSQTYPMLSGQITHRFKRLEVYLGGENILDYRVDNPIIDAENPFGENFDATRIWAPVYGVNVYAGFRWNINKD